MEVPTLFNQHVFLDGLKWPFPEPKKWVYYGLLKIAISGT